MPILNFKTISGNEAEAPFDNWFNPWGPLSGLLGRCYPFRPNLITKVDFRSNFARLEADSCFKNAT